MPPEPVTLALHCSKCGGAISVQFENWDQGTPSVEQFWLCPWCHEDQSGGFPGLVVWVAKREPSDRTH